MKNLYLALAAGSLLFAGSAGAAELVVRMDLIDAQGALRSAGTVTVAETRYGLLLSPSLSGLSPGLHGFHVHQNPSCAAAEKDGKPVAGLAAGGHLDPGATGKHLGPYRDGHLGDLPALHVGADGTAATPVLAPRLRLADLAGRSLMIHAGGDNYSDEPAALGGGGARAACGVVP